MKCILMGPADSRFRDTELGAPLDEPKICFDIDIKFYIGLTTLNLSTVIQKHIFIAFSFTNEIAFKMGPNGVYFSIEFNA